MMNRRDFFRVVAASGATAAASGCQRATETILPLVVPNEQIVPGVAAWFATVCRECPAGCGVIAKNREGRVVKLEGNPDHPVNQGALCARGQAALQGLYHPDRFTGPRLRDGAALKPVPWDAAQKVVADKLADLRSAAKGQAIALVTQLETSSLGALLDKWTQALGTRPRVTFEPFAYEALRAANRITFGRDAIPYFAFEDAEVVLSFGADFLETWLSNVNYARTFARMHTVRDGRAGTFIHVEPRQSLTASNADEWVRNAPGTEGQLALAMLKVMVDERLADRRFAEAVAAIDVKKIAADRGGLRFADAVKKVGLVVSLASQPDETTALAHIVLPDTHWLESWGDYSPREGVSGLMQPTMSPVRDSRPMGDTFLAIGRAVLRSEEGKGPLPWATFERYLRATWEPLVRDGWAATLRQGGVWKEPAPVVVSTRVAPADATPPKLEGEADGLALLAYPSLRFYDGRGASRAWLQEAPDTMTQAVWDPWVEIAAETAAKLGIAGGDVVRLTSPHGSIELPAYVSPTLHPRAVAVPVGHRYAPYHVPRYVPAPSGPKSPVAMLGAAAESGSGGPAYFGVRVTVARTGARQPLAILQATHDQEGRELAQAVDLRAAREQELRGREDHEAHLSMYPDQQYPGYRWGMAIDVDACVGCQACVVACQAENNVAVVGRAQAAYGRGMHWIRIERWAEGEPAHPANLFLPMLCQHCEVAPCEPVCPVFAAYRTDEGLNAQVYNRW